MNNNETYFEDIDNQEELDINLEENQILNQLDQKSSELVEQRFEQRDWLDAEKKVPPLEQAILKCLKNLGLGNDNDNESELRLLPVAGEEIYVNSRHLLSKWKDDSLLFEDYVISKYMDLIEKRKENFDKNKIKKNKKIINEISKLLNLLVNLSKSFDSVLEKISKKKLLDKIKYLLKQLEGYDGHIDCLNLIKQLETGSNDTKNKKSKKEKPLNKLDKMRLENLMNKYKSKIEILLNTFDKDHINTTYGFGQIEIVELLGVTFIYMAWFVLNHLGKYTKRSKLVEVYEIIVAIQRFINSCQTYEGKSMHNSMNKQKISNTMMLDLKFWLEELAEIYDFDGFKIYDIAPKLFVYTAFDSFIPQRGIGPRKNQVDLIKAIKGNLNSYPNDGILVILKAPIGSGKTFSATALVNLIKTLRDTKRGSGKILPELIFCCNLRSVKNQVANLAYNSDIKFGVGYIRKDRLRIVNHNTCKSDSERELIICSPNVAEQLLKQDFNRINKEGGENKYWLFLDEPTVGADQLGSDSLNKNVSVLINMPKYTILSSATMPDFENLEDLIKLHKEKFPNVHLETVFSGEIQIGCDVKFHNYDMILPHLLCKSKLDLINVIKRIESNPFLGRMYTYKVVRQLWEDLSPLTDKVPDLKIMFKDVNNLSSDKIRIVAMNMLKMMCDFDDDIIEKLCSLNFVNNLKKYDINEDKDSEKESITFGEEEDDEDSDVNYEYLGTTQAYRFQGMNLIVAPKPVDFAIKYFESLMNKLKQHNVDSSSKIIEKYNKELTSYNKLLEKVKENMSKYDNSSKNIQQAINSNMHDFKNNFSSYRKDVMDVFDSKMSRNENSGKISIDEKSSIQVQQLEQTKKPLINLPDWAQINTLQHIKFFAKSHLKQINPRLIRAQFPLEQLPLDVKVPDEVMLLLMCGVGIYSPSNNNLDYNYTRFVVDLALSGQLAYLIADASISYGTNYPIVRLFVTDEFVKQHSVYTLLQLMGRPGRVGHSYKAEVFLQQYAAELLLKFSHDPYNQLGLIEANNIKKTIESIINSNNAIKLEEQRKLDEQKKLEEQRKLEAQRILEEQKRLEEQRKLYEQKRLEEQRKLEEQHKLERQKRLDSERNGGYRANRSIKSEADTDSFWRKKNVPVSQENKEPENKSGVYVAPFAKKSTNEWKTVDNNKKKGSKWKN